MMFACASGCSDTYTSLCLKRSSTRMHYEMKASWQEQCDAIQVDITLMVAIEYTCIPLKDIFSKIMYPAIKQKWFKEHNNEFVALTSIQSSICERCWKTSPIHGGPITLTGPAGKDLLIMAWCHIPQHTSNSPGDPTSESGRAV